MHIIFKYDPCVSVSSSFWGSPAVIYGRSEEIKAFSNFLNSSLIDLRKEGFRWEIAKTGRCFTMDNFPKRGFAVSFESADIVLNYLEISCHTWEVEEDKNDLY